MHRGEPSPAAYRPDIDGLRAIAVLAVVAFHAFPGWAPGGFIGVDVFFVISGFLITGILVEANDAGTFRFTTFYARRARRIFPALVLVLLATCLLGALVLPALEYLRLGRHVVAAAFFSSNLLLWSESGYFDLAAASKPLLHLWSLGIEEQFYLAWPAAMVLLSRHARHRLAITAFIALASFALCVASVNRDPGAAFYSPATRAWELMAGAMLAMPGVVRALRRWPPFWRDVGSLAGAMLVVGPVFAFTTQLAFPGWWALAPVLGAVLLVAAGADAVVNRHLLSRRAAVSVGLVSYPLYLWHWPLLVLARYATGVPADADALPANMAALVVLESIILAYATYLLLERPLRRAAIAPAAIRASLALAGASVIGLTMMVRRDTLDHDTLTAERAMGDWTAPRGGNAPYFVPPAERDPAIVFIGDSHAEQYYPAIARRLGAGARPPSIAFSTRGGCPFLPTYRPGFCGDTYARSMALASLPSVRRVVIASAWDMYSADGRMGETHQLEPAEAREAFAALELDVARLRALGKEVVLVGPHPHAAEADPALLVSDDRIGRFGTLEPTRFAASFPLAAFRARTALEHALLVRVGARTGARWLDPADVLCPGGTCLTTDEEGTPLRKDSNHLRPFAVNRYLTYIPSLIAAPAR